MMRNLSLAKGLASIKDEMAMLTYDRALMLAHHSVLSTDEDPLINSKRVTDFILRNYGDSYRNLTVTAIQGFSAIDTDKTST